MGIKKTAKGVAHIRVLRPPDRSNTTRLGFACRKTGVKKNATWTKVKKKPSTKD